MSLDIELWKFLKLSERWGLSKVLLHSECVLSFVFAARFGIFQSKWNEIAKKVLCKTTVVLVAECQGMTWRCLLLYIGSTISGSGSRSKVGYVEGFCSNNLDSQI